LLSDTVVLPNLIFGAYEALAARLATEKVGSELQVFIAPQDALPATIHNVTDETIKVPGRTIAARRWTLHMGGATPKLEMDVWTEGSRLLRLDIRPRCSPSCGTTSRASPARWSRWPG
jgi:hypothetical protein